MFFSFVKSVWSPLTCGFLEGSLCAPSSRGCRIASCHGGTKHKIKRFFSSPWGYAGNLKIQLECNWAVTSSRSCWQSRHGSWRRYLAGAWRPGVVARPRGVSANVSFWLSVALANVPVPQIPRWVPGGLYPSPLHQFRPAPAAPSV